MTRMVAKDVQGIREEIIIPREERKEGFQKNRNLPGDLEVVLSVDENKTKASLQQLANVREHDHILIKEDQIILEEDLSLSEPSKLSTIVPDRQDPADDQAPIIPHPQHPRQNSRRDNIRTNRHIAQRLKAVETHQNDHENHKNKFLSSNLSTKTYDQQDPVDDQDTEDDNLCYHGPKIKHDRPGPFKAFSVLGNCTYFDAKIIPPKNGLLHGIDFYYQRENKAKRENCFLRCVKNLTHNEIDATWLINSIKLGLPKVVQELHTNFGLDPLFAPDEELNAVQEGIRSGHTEIVKILSNSNNEMVIDKYGRTIADYVRMKGSPIRPAEAKSILGLSVDSAEGVTHGRALAEDRVLDDTVHDSGWNEETTMEYSERCDLDVVDNEMPQDVFLRDYFETGRPFVLRGHIPKAEKAAFSKNRWDYIRKYNTHRPVWKVGPTAYPSITGQRYCKRKFTISEIEDGTECEEMPGVPMVTAWHPTDEDFNLLYPMYKDEEFYKLSGWRKIEDWFGPPKQWEDEMSWQTFLGGDGSGATIHWHAAAFNVLYIGTKEWRLTPPKYKGWSGMPAKRLAEQLDDSYTLRCTQHEGDIIYVPEDWGHMTMNHGFTIGAAVLLPPGLHKLNQHNKGGYKMNIVDNQPKTIPFLFVHINKTGGTSIIEMFNKHCGKQYVKERWGNGHRSFHSTALSYIDHYGRDTWDTAYTFAVVRHPLARQVSNYFFIAEICEGMGVCKERLIEERVRGNKMNKLTDEEKVNVFHRWVLELYNLYPPGSDDNYRFGSLGDGNEEMMSFNSTQTSWIVDENDKIAVDEIFHLESLDENVHKLAKAIPCLKNNQQRENKKVEMVHSNITSNKYPDYKLFTKNKTTKKIMKEVYAADFRNFGYKYKM